jgi:hypothetical protein
MNLLAAENYVAVLRRNFRQERYVILRASRQLLWMDGSGIFRDRAGRSGAERSGITYRSEAAQRKSSGEEKQLLCSSPSSLLLHLFHLLQLLVSFLNKAV